MDYRNVFTFGKIYKKFKVYCNNKRSKGFYSITYKEKILKLGGNIKLVDHDKYEWVETNRLKEFDFLDGDLPIINNLINTSQQTQYQNPYTLK